MELDYDTAEALGLDGTGRFTSRTFPFTVEGLRDHELILLDLLAQEAYHYGHSDDVVCLDAAHYVEASHRAVMARFGLMVENLSEYATAYHASLRDLIDSMLRDPADVMAIITERKHLDD